MEEKNDYETLKKEIGLTGKTKQSIKIYDN